MTSSLDFMERHNRRQAARGRPMAVGPLFAALTAELAPQAAPAPVPVQETAPLRALDYAAPELPAPRVAGPCPVMAQARADLEAEAARIVTRATLGLNLGRGPLELYSYLVTCALGRLVHLGVTRRPDVAEVHMPAELAAFCLEVDRVTIWRWAQALDAAADEETGEVRGAGLIARCDHKTTGTNPYGAHAALDAHEARQKARGEATKRRRAVSDGVVWAVSLTGPIAGLAVSAEAKRHAWRDLAGDARATHRAASKAEDGTYTYAPEALHTVWALKKTGLQQSLQGLKADKGRTLGLRWAVNPGFRSPHPSQMTVATALPPSHTAIWDVLTLRGLSRPERGAAVDAAALRLASALGDERSVNLYRWVLWRLFRLDVEGRDYWDKVITILSAIHKEARDGDCTTPGAMFLHRLRRAGIWDELKDVALYRVGSKLAAA